MPIDRTDGQWVCDACFQKGGTITAIGDGYSAYERPMLHELCARILLGLRSADARKGP
jgi:hypothetical protein